MLDTEIRNTQLRRLYQSLTDVNEQVERAEKILQKWPHAQHESVFVETAHGKLFFRRPYILLEEANSDSRKRISELPAMIRLEVVREIKSLFDVCETVIEQCLINSEQSFHELAGFLDSIGDSEE